MSGAAASHETNQCLRDDHDRADDRREEDREHGPAQGDGLPHHRFMVSRRRSRQTGSVVENDSVVEGAERPRLLIIDDGPDMVRLLEAITSSTWEVHSAANLAEAVELAEAHPVDVAVVDFMLPGGGGFSVARRLKELQPDCTVVMFSAAPVGHQAADSPDVDEFVMKGDVRVIRRLLDDLARRMQS